MPILTGRASYMSPTTQKYRFLYVVFFQFFGRVLELFTLKTVNEKYCMVQQVVYGPVYLHVE